MLRNRKWRLVAIFVMFIMTCTARRTEEKRMGEQQIWSDNARTMMAYVCIDSERIETGSFSLGEKRMLQALAQAENFLQVRYPAEKMTFTKVNNVSINAQTYQFEVVSDAAPEEVFAVKVTPACNADGTEMVQESRFNDLMRPQLQELVQMMLTQEKVESVCDINVIGLYGAEYDPQKALVELLEAGLLVDVYGLIYVKDTQSAETLVPRLEKVLRGVGLCGGISLVEVSAQDWEDVTQMLLNDNPGVTARFFLSLPADLKGEAE